MADINSENTITANIIPGEGVLTTVSWNHEAGGIWYHVLVGWDTEVQGTVGEPAHMLGVLSESAYSVLPDNMIPEGMTVAATYDHPPTDEELDSHVPEDYRDHLTRGKK